MMWMKKELGALGEYVAGMVKYNKNVEQQAKKCVTMVVEI